MKREKQWPVDYIIKENPNLSWDDLHDVREIAELYCKCPNCGRNAFEVKKR